MPTIQNLTGRTFGALTVIGRGESRTWRVRWECRCACGNSATVRADSLMRGTTVSCGCRSKQRLAEHRDKHGYADTPTYKIWCGMKRRCMNSAHDSYPDYGGRGISVCERWLVFENFLADMGERPSGLSIERIDTNGNYEPGNCRWATSKEQGHNKRSSVNVQFCGKTQTIAQWAEDLGMNYDTLYARLVVHRWGTERALLRPVQSKSQTLAA